MEQHVPFIPKKCLSSFNTTAQPFFHEYHNPSCTTASFGKTDYPVNLGIDWIQFIFVGSLWPSKYLFICIHWALLLEQQTKPLEMTFYPSFHLYLSIHISCILLRLESCVKQLALQVTHPVFNTISRKLKKTLGSPLPSTPAPFPAENSLALSQPKIALNLKRTHDSKHHETLLMGTKR